MIGLGERLRNLRESRNISQSEVARQINLAKSTIAGYEGNASSPSLESLCLLANLYNVSTDYILGRSKDTKLTFDLSSLDADQIKIVSLLINKFKTQNLELEAAKQKSSSKNPL